MSLEQHGQTFQGQKLGGWTKRRHSTAVQQVYNTMNKVRQVRKDAKRFLDGCTLHTRVYSRQAAIQAANHRPLSSVSPSPASCHARRIMMGCELVLSIKPASSFLHSFKAVTYFMEKVFVYVGPHHPEVSSTTNDRRTRTGRGDDESTQVDEGTNAKLLEGAHAW